MPTPLPSPEGLAYLSYQEAGIAFTTARPSVLLADPPGLGKTVQALGALNATPAIRTVLVVCPATLKLNWRNEALKWLCRELQYVLLVVDSQCTSAQLRTFLAPTDGTRRMAIVNYDLLHRYSTTISFPTFGQAPIETYTFLEGFVVDQVIADECQLMRNGASRRSKAVRGIAAGRKLLLSGTPMENRPEDLWPVLHYLDPFTYPSMADFQRTYCMGDLASLHRLQSQLRTTIMIRRRKEDVLPELPQKIRQVIELPAKESAPVVAEEWAAYRRYQTLRAGLKAAVAQAKLHKDDASYRHAVRALSAGVMVARSQLARVRHATVQAKLPQVMAHLENCLEAQEKVVVFLWHRDIATALAQRFTAWQPAVVTGAVSTVARTKAVERFQADPACRIFLGSLPVASLGLTLTAAHHVVFIELDWKPSIITQAEDKLARMGQRSSVLAQHLVLEDSLDCTMAHTIIAKQIAIDAALDPVKESP